MKREKKERYEENGQEHGRQQEVERDLPYQNHLIE